MVNKLLGLLGPVKVMWETVQKKRFWLATFGAASVAGVATAMKQMGFDDDMIKQAMLIVGGLFGGSLVNNAAADFGKEAKKLEGK